MPDLWYYGKNEQRLGPVPLKELQRLVSSRDLDGTDLVWSPGMADWTAVSEVEVLFSASASSAIATPRSPSPKPPSPPSAPSESQSPVAEDRWHYECGGERRSPVSFEELKRLAAMGQLNPDSLVWKRGMAEWTPAGQIESLFSSHSEPVAQPAAQPADLWYYGDGEQRHGPVSMDELKALARSGQLARSDLVWNRGMTEWTPAAEVGGLFSALAELPLRARRRDCQPLVLWRRRTTARSGLHR